MPIYTVSWIGKTRYWTKIEADSAEEALSLVKEGKYRDVDSDAKGEESGYKVQAGEHGAGNITRKAEGR